jgi:hypothetical protein
MIIAAVAAGCADRPPSNAMSPAPAAPSGIAAPVTSADPARAADSGADAAHRDLEKNARTMGYKAKKDSSGETKWCKTEAHIGTHFETTSCISEDRMFAQVQEMLKTQDLMRSMAGQCNGSNCTSH